MNAQAQEQALERPPLTPAEEAAFERDLLAALPRVRAAAIFLTRDHDKAGDLVQDTLLRAWKARASYQMGTNMVAWLCFIQRNQFISGRRRDWRWQQMPILVGKDGSETEAVDLLPTPATQGDALDLEELQTAITYLPVEMAHALRLVAIDGLTYEEAAAEVGAEVGTIKSRVSRGRTLLDHYFGLDRRDA